MQDFFERTVFRSESGGSEFEPHTCTMYLYRPKSDRPFESVGRHELTHWLQFVCSTVGGFLSALMHFRDELAKTILSQPVRSSLPESEEQFFNSTFFHEGIDKKISFHQNYFRDALICERLFFRMSTCYGLSSVRAALKPELLIPRTLLRINNWATDILCYKSTEPKGYLDELTEHQKLINFRPAEHSSIELDTRDIIEGMAVANEVYYLRLLRMEEHIKQRLVEIESNPASRRYLHALEIFLEIMGFPIRFDSDEEIERAVNNIIRMAMMFFSIAELSLSPPLQPFGIINKLEFDWNKIYPPLRFIELCQIAKRVVGTRGYIIDSSDDSLLTMVQSLYLSQGGAYCNLLKDKNSYLPNEKLVPFLAVVAEENPIIAEILRLKGVNTIGMAEKLPKVLERCTGLEVYAMLRHGVILFMNQLRTLRLIPSEDEDANIKYTLYMPPLVVYEDGYQVSGWSETFAQYLINLNLFNYPVHDIFLERILRREPRVYLPNNPLVPEWKRRLLWDYVQREYCESLDHERNTVREKNDIVASSFRQSDSSEYS